MIALSALLSALLPCVLPALPSPGPAPCPPCAPQDATAAQAAPVATPGGEAEDSAVPAIELALEDAIAEAFRNNLGLKSAGLQTQAAVAGLGSAWGEFDPRFFTQVTRSESISAPTPSNFVGGVDVGASPATEFDLLAIRSGVRGMLETGTLWQFDIGPTNSRTTVHTTPTDRQEVDVADWNFSLTQPLLRGGADDYAISGLELAAADVDISAADTRQETYTTLVAVITAYWNLVFARQNVATVELSVTLANELLDITNRKFQQGLQNRIEVIEVEADLARRREELLTSRNSVEQAVDDLRTLVFAPDGDEWNGDIVPTTTYEEVPDAPVDSEEAIADALQFRPDILRARLEVERADIEVRRAKNQARPRFDVTGGYGLNSNETNMGHALTRLDDTGLHEARIAFDLEIPIGNRTAGYALRRRTIERDRFGVALRETEMLAIAEVRRAARDVTLQIERVNATAETMRLRLEVYEGEKRRLENDLSTPFQVRQAQRDYLLAVDDETRAQLDLAVAQTSLLAARGRLLQYYGFQVSAPDTSLSEKPPAP